MILFIIFIALNILTVYHYVRYLLFRRRRFEKGWHRYEFEMYLDEKVSTIETIIISSWIFVLWIILIGLVTYSLASIGAKIFY